MVTQEQVDLINKVFRGEISKDRAKQQAIALDPNSNKSRHRGGGSPKPKPPTPTPAPSQPSSPTQPSHQTLSTSPSGQRLEIYTDSAGNKTLNRTDSFNRVVASQKLDAQNRFTQGNYQYQIDDRGTYNVVARPAEVERRNAFDINLNNRINRGEDVRAGDLSYDKKTIPFNETTVAQSTASNYQAQQRAANVKNNATYAPNNEPRNTFLASPSLGMVNRPSVGLDGSGIISGKPFYRLFDRIYFGSSNNNATYSPFSPLASSQNQGQTKQLSILKEVPVSKIDRFLGNIDISLHEKKKSRPNLAPLYETGQVLVGGGKAAVNVGLFLKDMVIKPVQTSSNLFSSFVAAAKNPFAVGEKIRISIINEPGQLTGETLFNLLGPKAAGSAVALGRDVAVASIGKYVPPSSVIDTAVLAGKSTFPIETNVNKAFSQFKNTLDPATGRYSVVSAGPTKYPSSSTILVGARGAQNLEDAGLFATPKGRASAYFLGLEGNQGYSFSLNPLRPVIDSFKSAPTITEFKVTGIGRYPKRMLLSKGFEESNEFIKARAKTGAAFQTKRSTLGQTPEIEAVVPGGTTFKYIDRNPFGREFTYYKGRVVRLRTAVTEGTGLSTPKRSSMDMFRYFRKGSSSYSKSRPKSIAPSYGFLNPGSSSAVSQGSSMAPSSSYVGSTGGSVSRFRSYYGRSSYFGGSYSRPFGGSGGSSGKPSRYKYPAYSGGSSGGSSGFGGGSYYSPVGGPLPPLPVSKLWKNTQPAQAKKAKQSFSRYFGKFTQYTPTAYAAAFNLKGTRLKGTLSGLEFRGLVRRKKKR